jgi:toxin ParE1/3/4
MSGYRIATTARREISKIYRHIAQDNLSAADRWLSRLFEQFTLLAQNPEMGELRPELDKELRSVSSGNYVIYFRPGQNEVQIARVVHGARDVRKVFRKPSR